MPTWSIPQDKQLTDALDQTLAGLGADIADNPSVMEVTGLPPNALLAHAAKAVNAYRGTHSDPQAPESLIQLYTMGFIIGMRFGAQDGHTPTG